VLDEVAAHARAASPAECCGLLVGSPSHIVGSVRSANLAGDPARRFLIDPKTHFETRRTAGERGLAVIGFYHSHPVSEPVPSESDLAGASYQDHWYLIVQPLEKGCRARLFKLEGVEFHEEAMKPDA
jgi:proteasome lid subunit RPN8/RPN11